MNVLVPYRRLLLVGATLVAIALGGVIFAVHDAKHRILQALGPRTTVGSISLSYPVVTLHDVHIGASDTPGAWPANEEFDAKKVGIRITAASLWAYRCGKPLVIDAVAVRDGTLVMLRTPDRLTMLPALRETALARAAAMPASSPATAPPATMALVVQRATFDNMAIDLHDTTLPDGKAQHLHFDQVRGSIDNLALPGLGQPIAIDLQGTLKGVEHDGQVSLKGSLAPAAHDAHLAIRLVGVDMIALQAYVLRFGERTVRHGLLDLSMDASVVDRQVHAPGQLTITGLAFGDAVGGTFAGVERRAVLATLARDGRISLKFTLDGRTDDPKFSLDEHLAVRIAAGLGEAVGVSVKGVVEGVGGVLKGLLGGRGDKATAKP